MSLIILVDSRERNPWFFKPYQCSTYTTQLVYGDYAICGLTNELLIERKSFSDLKASLTVERRRFEKMVASASATTRVVHIVTESYLTNYDTHTANVVASTVWSWTFKYPNVHWWLMGTRKKAEFWSFQLMEMFWRKRWKTSRSSS